MEKKSLPGSGSSARLGVNMANFILAPDKETTDSSSLLCYKAANAFGDKETCMPRFIIERNFAEKVEANRDVVTAITQVNADVGVQWLFSFLSADKKKTYCLYEAPNAEAIRDAARRLNIPADVIIEVDSEIRPEAFLR